jgi:protein involved in polysaccharide export with SLBB domain
MICGALSGCAALTNPVADGIPVRHLTPEFLGPSKTTSRPLPLNLLRQPPPDIYKLAPGDILGVWIEGVLGEPKQPPPLRLPERGDLPPALGFPIPVREDGTVSLPLVDPIRVKDMSIEDARKAILKVYTDKEILKAGRERIIVTLMRRRQYHVLVFREGVLGGVSVTQDPNAFSYGPEGISMGSSQLVGTQTSKGYAVDLPAYENDVLNALAQTGGLPSPDSNNEIIIQRGYLKAGQDAQTLLRDLQAQHGDWQTMLGAGVSGKLLRIPLRVQPGDELSFKPEDIVLETGDIVYLPARRPELYYTGGLLPAGEYALPRDRDLDVLEAIARIRGPLLNGAFATNNLSGTIVQSGIGNPSPSLLTILRRMPGGTQLAIRVDLNRAFRDPRERPLVQPGDFLVLQETSGEGMARYFTEMFKFNFIYQVIHGKHETGTITATVP